MLYRAFRAEWSIFAALPWSWFGETRRTQLRPEERQWLWEHWKGRAPRQVFAKIATADSKGLRNRVGALWTTGREAVFLGRKWGRLVVGRLGPLAAIKIEHGLVLNDLVLVLADGLRIQFTLLAGQSERAREEMKRLSPAIRTP